MPHLLMTNKITTWTRWEIWKMIMLLKTMSRLTNVDLKISNVLIPKRSPSFTKHSNEVLKLTKRRTLNWLQFKRICSWCTHISKRSWKIGKMQSKTLSNWLKFKRENLRVKLSTLSNRSTLTKALKVWLETSQLISRLTRRMISWQSIPNLLTIMKKISKSCLNFKRGYQQEM